MEPEKPQDAQIVFPDPLIGIFDEPDAAGEQIRQSAQRIDDHTIRSRIKRVHREIAAAGILDHRIGKGDDSAPAIRGHIAAKGRDLERGIFDNHSDCSMVYSGRDHLQPRRRGQLYDNIRPCIRRQVQIGDRCAQQRVAHATANEPRLMTRIRQHATDLLRGRIGQPCARDACHDTRSAKARRMRAVAPQM